MQSRPDRNAGAKRTCKPGSVVRGEPRTGDHFSRTAVARRLQQPTRRLVRNGPFRDGPCGPFCPLLGLAPDGVCRARPVTRPAGELLPHRFTLTGGPLSRRRLAAGGLLSVALSLTFRPVGVTHHRALWSPDFPPAVLPRPAAARSAPLPRPGSRNRNAAAEGSPLTRGVRRTSDRLTTAARPPKVASVRFR